MIAKGSRCNWFQNIHIIWLRHWLRWAFANFWKWGWSGNAVFASMSWYGSEESQMLNFIKLCIPCPSTKMSSFLCSAFVRQQIDSCIQIWSWRSQNRKNGCWSPFRHVLNARFLDSCDQIVIECVTFLLVINWVNRSFKPLQMNKKQQYLILISVVYRIWDQRVIAVFLMSIDGMPSSYFFLIRHAYLTNMFVKSNVSYRKYK